MAITNCVVEHNWVERFAEEERRRGQVPAHDAAVAAHRADVAQFHVNTLMDALRERAQCDVEEFGRQFPERAIVYEDVPLDGGFIVRRGHYPEARLTVAPNGCTGIIHIDYVFASSEGIFSPKGEEIVFGEDDLRGWHFRDEPGHPVRTIDQLSEYLLVPVLTGRSRVTPPADAAP